MNTVSHFSQIFSERLKLFVETLNNKTPAELYEPMQYILSLGGKRLRPVLAYLGNDLFNGNLYDAHPAALAIEIFHNFSLVHDDIMDKAPLRRGKATVHEKWNSNIAILSGDSLLVKAYEELTKAKPEHLKLLIETFNKTAIEVCEGQQLDMNFENINEVSTNEYIRMITLKTAVLLGAALKMGAITANATFYDADNIYAFGKNIGIAFQLQDDILDVFGNPEKFGKKIGGDIIGNKKTWLLIEAKKQASGALKEKLVHWINLKDFNPSEKVSAIKSVYEELNIKEQAEKEMAKYYQLALTHLSNINADKNKIQNLIDFAKELLNREI
ncbi:MAG: polyprenyl synthetase family protein [Bacteroidia bacterium]